MVKHETVFLCQTRQVRHYLLHATTCQAFLQPREKVTVVARVEQNVTVVPTPRLAEQRPYVRMKPAMHKRKDLRVACLAQLCVTSSTCEGQHEPKDQHTTEIATSQRTALEAHRSWLHVSPVRRGGHKVASAVSMSPHDLGGSSSRMGSKSASVNWQRDSVC